jgi:hypothetical protein
MYRAEDVLIGALTGEYESLGRVKDLLSGVDLSPLEQIWDNAMKGGAPKPEDKDRAQLRRRFHELRQRLQHLRPRRR